MSIYAIAIAVAALACATDLRSRRIPNMLTFGAALGALALHGAGEGVVGLKTATFGWLVGAALFFPLFALGGLGAGDVKLLAALGAWLGPMGALQVAFYSSLAGGVMALVVAMRTGYLSTALRNLKFMGTVWMTCGVGPVEGMTLTDQKGPRLAYAVPIFAGLVVTLCRQ
jgi:prepilin peptidase CpaA